jgi:hypothetical protein
MSDDDKSRIRPRDADADLARLIRFLRSADPRLVRRLVEMIFDEGIELADAIVETSL